MMRAIIDIGTNSVRLLIAEKDEKEEWKILKKDLRSTRLGEGMTDKAFIGKGPPGKDAEGYRRVYGGRPPGRGF